MSSARFFTVLTVFIVATTAKAETFRITTLQAAPGALEQMIRAAVQYRDSHNGGVLIMRHSQGDYWDLLLLEPAAADALQGPRFVDLELHRHSFLARADTDWESLSSTAVDAGLFHIEMFYAAPSRHGDLLEQRKAENAYLAATGQVTNVIFETVFGSDVDAFTIGFHDSLASFAADPDRTSEQLEKAAQEAGFASRADIGLFLRKLIVRHQDTLAVPVP